MEIDSFVPCIMTRNLILIGDLKISFNLEILILLALPHALAIKKLLICHQNFNSNLMVFFITF